MKYLISVFVEEKQFKNIGLTSHENNTSINN